MEASKMPTLNTGLIISGGYADKVRKTLFAQLRSAVGSGSISSQEVARAVAELNQALYGILVDKLKAERGDVVRVRVDYEVAEGRVQWLWNTLRIELFRRVPDEEVARQVAEALAEAEKAAKAVEAYTVERAVTTSLGDSLYRVLLEGRRVGIFMASRLGEEAVVKGATVEPAPTIIEGYKLNLQGRSLDEAIAREVSSIIQSGRKTSPDEAEKALKELEAIIEAEAGKAS
ncbi:MAG: DUF2258 domain-containing protein [Candidatus Hecatellaceae archaeon]